jgi:hypothetical protein
MEAGMNLDDAERRALQGYQRAVRLLFERPALKERRLVYNVRFDHTGWSARLGATEDELIALATQFRLVSAQGEKGSFGRIRGILRRHAVYPGSHEILKRVNEDWQRAHRGYVQLQATWSDGRQVSLDGAKMLDLWFNGRVFHSNEDDVAMYDELEREWGAMTTMKVYETFNLLLVPISNLNVYVGVVLETGREPMRLPVTLADGREGEHDLVHDLVTELAALPPGEADSAGDPDPSPTPSPDPESD